ncbi:CD63 antigen-like [Cydia strobilella]|uniref:CD63 antigen-like n=1 Tax=Cydia strobilella TaxID=1100964 RepID=UPI0030070110
MRKVILFILNILYALFGLALFLGGVAFWIYVAQFTALRNTHHYKLDFSLYWPQVIPVVACLAGIFVIFVACCGCCTASKNNKGFTIMQSIFIMITLIVLITCAALTLKYGDNEETDVYLIDALTDGFSEAKTSPNHQEMFSRIESWLGCCGAEGSSSYRPHGVHFLPQSCCGYSDDSNQKCEFTSKEATDRHGCVKVVVSYSRLFLRVLAAAAAVAAFFGILSLVATLALSIGLNKKPAVYDATDIETKKGLL